MKETSMMDNYNCKTQAHARVHEENKSEKNDAYWNNLAVKVQAWRIIYEEWETYHDDMIHHSIKVLVLY